MDHTEGESPLPVSVPEPLDSVEDLAALYVRHGQRMVRLAQALTGSTALAEEVVHDAFLAVYNQRESVENPSAYLRRTVVNGCQTLLRRHRNEQDKLDILGGWLQADSHRPPVDIDETWQALWTLSTRPRIALTLRYYLDLTVDDIAKAMNVRPGTVKSLLHRGLRELRKELADDNS